MTENYDGFGGSGIFFAFLIFAICSSRLTLARDFVDLRNSWRLVAAALRMTLTSFCPSFRQVELRLPLRGKPKDITLLCIVQNNQETLQPDLRAC